MISAINPTAIPQKALQIRYLPEDLAPVLADDPYTMAVIQFSDKGSATQPHSPNITVGLRQLNGDQQLEVWRSKRPVNWLLRENITFCTTGDMLFGHMLIEESSASNLEQISKAAYQALLSLTRQQGYPYLLRIWNYFPNINRQQSNLERYQSFCIGRHHAFAEHNEFEHQLPAATAISTHSPGFLIYFLASKQPGLQIENPRQVSAFRYPKSYSPKSPSFSRAILKQWGDQSDLYISGTASVVGHETRHVDDISGQLAETANNIKQLQIEALQQGNHATTEVQLLKVYLRRTEDLPLIDKQIGRLLGEEVARIYLHADICREALLLEIDGYSTAEITS